MNYTVFYSCESLPVQGSPQDRSLNFLVCQTGGGIKLSIFLNGPSLSVLLIWSYRNQLQGSEDLEGGCNS